jgi:hypothetical protein
LGIVIVLVSNGQETYAILAAILSGLTQTEFYCYAFRCREKREKGDEQ